MFDEPQVQKPQALPSFSKKGGPPSNLPTVDDLQEKKGIQSGGEEKIPKKEEKIFPEREAPVEDILEGTQAGVSEAARGFGKKPEEAKEKVASFPSSPTSGTTSPAEIQTMPQTQVPSLEEKPSSKKKIFLIVGIVIVVGVGLVLGGSYLYHRFYYSRALEVTPPIETEKLSPPEATEPASEVPKTGIPETPKAPLDSDGDGLTDAEEAVLGTNFNDPDTDKDELPDLDEVKIYKTDPLNPDTDGDGYLDGVEVKNGYNPKGSGKLLELPQS